MGGPTFRDEDCIECYCWHGRRSGSSRDFDVVAVCAYPAGGGSPGGVIGVVDLVVVVGAFDAVCEEAACRHDDTIGTAAGREGGRSSGGGREGCGEGGCVGGRVGDGGREGGKEGGDVQGKEEIELQQM